MSYSQAWSLMGLLDLELKAIKEHKSTVGYSRIPVPLIQELRQLEADVRDPQVRLLTRQCREVNVHIRLLNGSGVYGLERAGVVAMDYFEFMEQVDSLRSLAQRLKLLFGLIFAEYVLILGLFTALIMGLVRGG